jgi:hypothetical protein
LVVDKLTGNISATSLDIVVKAITRLNGKGVLSASDSLGETRARGN